MDVPIPLGFIDNDVVINELDISFEGEMEAVCNKILRAELLRDKPQHAELSCGGWLELSALGVWG